jgi:hypothetical protein
MPSPNWSQRALAAIFAPDPAASDQTLPQPGLLTGPAEPIVVPAGSGFGVSVKPAAWILAGAAPATVGSVLWAPPGYVGATLAAANPTLPRNDLITIQVTDPGSSSAAGSSDVIVVQGAAASSPTDPTVPTGALVIARVVVRAGTSSIVQNDITNFRCRPACVAPTRRPAGKSPASTPRSAGRATSTTLRRAPGSARSSTRRM